MSIFGRVVSALRPDNIFKAVGKMAYKKLNLSNRKNPLRKLPFLRKFVEQNEPLPERVYGRIEP